MPSGLIDEHHAVGAGIDGLADLGQMRRHRRSVTPWHDQPGALAFGGTDGAEDVGPFGALVAGCPGAGSLARPASRDLVLLPDPGLVLPPQLYLRPGREARPDLRQLGGKVFLKASIASSFWAWWHGRAVIFR